MSATATGKGGPTMPTLENDELVFRFPQIRRRRALLHRISSARCGSRIRKKTYSAAARVRVVSAAARRGLPRKTAGPDDGSRWRHPADVAGGGDVAELRPIAVPNGGLDFPVAIKVAAGKINAVTGDGWRTGLHREPQDYMVSPEQPWLDGFAVEPGRHPAVRRHAARRRLFRRGAADRRGGMGRPADRGYSAQGRGLAGEAARARQIDIQCCSDATFRMRPADGPRCWRQDAAGHSSGSIQTRRLGYRRR